MQFNVSLMRGVCSLVSSDGSVTLGNMGFLHPPKGGGGGGLEKEKGVSLYSEVSVHLGFLGGRGTVHLSKVWL